MKKYLLFFAIFIVSGCALIFSTYKERNEINEILKEKEFYIVEGKSYKCNVKGPFKAKAEVMDSYYYSYIDDNIADYNISDRTWSRYIHRSDNNILVFLNKDSETKKEAAIFSDIKMKQTIFSEKQLFTALNKIGGGCGCAWHIAEGEEEHYTAVIEKSVFDKEFPIVKKVFEKKATTAKKKAREAAEEKAKKEAEKKRKAGQEAVEKNNHVMKKYGKPYCNPFEAINRGDGEYIIAGGSYSGRKRNCLFEEFFHISQATPYGMLVYGSERVCERGDLFMPPYCYDKDKGPYFVIPNESDKELIDGDGINGLFEYIGTYSYETILRAPKTVLKFKHVE